ncbi:MAG TPA: hypothetical protein VFT79_06800 [Solirubrobacterales bacterium]|nr:hypothetical protein [Solirubrobacterales bacterium]
MSRGTHPEHPGPEDEELDSQPEAPDEDDPTAGFGVGNQIESISELEPLDHAGEDPQLEEEAEDDPSEGFGTSGGLKAPSE